MATDNGSTLQNVSLNGSSFSLLPENYNPATDTVQYVNGQYVLTHYMTPEELQPYILAATLILCGIMAAVGWYIGTRYGAAFKAKYKRLRGKHA